MATVCRAQTSCDSIYSAEDKFRDGKIGLILFEVAPQISNKQKLENYTGSKERVGAVMYRVLIDEVGNASCLKFAFANNNLLIDEANTIAQSLSFTPALSKGKGIKSMMYVTIRFLEEEPKKHRRSMRW